MKFETGKKYASGAKASSLLRGAVLAASLIALAGTSLAQTPSPPAPQPSPSPPAPQPSPSPVTPTPESENPYADPTIGPAVDKTMEHLKPPAFKSPLGSKPGQGEEDAFAKLVPLYEQMQAAREAYDRASRCGSNADRQSAFQAMLQASDAYSAALGEYIRDYSSILYPTGRLSGALDDSFEQDRAKVTAAVQKASKYAPHPIQACPSPHQATTGNPPPKPEPGPPLPPPKSGMIDQLLGHVSIGVGVGVGGGRRGRDDDSRGRDDDKTPKPTDDR